MKKLYLIIIIFFGLIATVDLFHPGLPLTHDGQDHIARIANFYQNLTEGNIIPRWAPNLNWGYGHPILEFLYPLPSYLSSFFHFSGLSLVDSVKVVFGLGVIGSGFFMYLWLTQFLGIYASFMGALLYMYAPYRFIDLYVRGDIGEHLAFVFIPLVAYFIFKLSKKIKSRYVAGVGFSLAFLILSHNAISLMFIPFIVFYGVFMGLSLKNQKEYFINFIFSLVLGFGLSAFFWVPGLLEAKYTLRNIVTKGSYVDRFVNIAQLFYGSWNYGGTGQFTVQLGVLHWISLLLSPLLALSLFSKKLKDYIFVIFLIAYTAAAIFIMLPQSDFIWSRILLLQNFQFPWRFLAIPVFSCSVLGALMFDLIPAKAKLISVITFSVLILIVSRDYYHANGYISTNEKHFTGIYNSTTDTGESAPIWSVRFMEKRPKSHIEVISGKAAVEEIKRNSTQHSYRVVAGDGVQLRENTLFFPGWKVKIDGKLVPIEFQSGANRGVITFYVEAGKHVVDVNYSETKLRFASDFISLAALFMILSYNVWSKKLWKAYL